MYGRDERIGASFWLGLWADYAPARPGHAAAPGSMSASPSARRATGLGGRPMPVFFWCMKTKGAMEIRKALAAGLLCAVAAVLILRHTHRRHTYAGIRHEPMRLPPEP